MTDKPIDFKTHRERRNERHGRKIGPIYSVDVFSGEDGKSAMFRCIGVPSNDAGGIRAMAYDCFEAGLGFLSSAYDLDHDTYHYPRMHLLLFHSGRYSYKPVNPGLGESSTSLAWMRRMLGVVIEHLEKEEAEARERESKQQKLAADGTPDPGDRVRLGGTEPAPDA